MVCVRRTTKRWKKKEQTYSVQGIIVLKMVLDSLRLELVKKILHDKGPNPSLLPTGPQSRSQHTYLFIVQFVSKLRQTLTWVSALRILSNSCCKDCDSNTKSFCTVSPLSSSVCNDVTLLRSSFTSSSNTFCGWTKLFQGNVIIKLHLKWPFRYYKS